MSYSYAFPLSPAFTEQRQAPTLVEVQGQSFASKLIKKWQDLIQLFGHPVGGPSPVVGGPGGNW